MQSPHDADLIAFAGRRYNAAGAQVAAIRREFDLTDVRFWQLVNAVLDDPARIGALPPELWPVVKRLDEQRLRARGQRSPRRLAG